MYRRPSFVRTFYSKRATFITIDAQGQRFEREIDIRVGDENEAYVLIPTDVGDAIKSACEHNGAATDREPLVWNYTTRDFTSS